MTVTANETPLLVETAPIETVPFDMYRDIHKGIRNGLFAVTFQAGAADPGDPGALGAVATRWGAMVRMLISHAEHEETFVQPVLGRIAPALADEVAATHVRLETEMARLEVLADRAASSCADRSRLLAHRVYLGLASFTASYLQHCEFEELEVNVALSSVLGRDELHAIDHAIVASIPPEELAEDAMLMLPAMNVLDRVELAEDVRATAPAEVFAGVVALAQAALTPDDYAEVARRLGIA